MSKKIYLVVSMLVFMALPISNSGVYAQAPQDCSVICGQYENYGPKPGAPETIEFMQKLYNACMRCKSHRDDSPSGPKSLECKEGQYVMWLDGKKYCAKN